MPVDKNVWPTELHRKVWLVNEAGHPEETTLVGESKVSWLTGSRWHPLKYNKKKCRLITENDYRRLAWLDKESWNITNTLKCSRDYALLELVAERLGMELHYKKQEKP